LKSARLSVDLACAQDDVEGQLADIDSEEELEDTTLQDPSSAEENDDLEWHHQLHSGKTGLYQFVGEQNGLNKTPARKITENSQPRDFFLLYFQTLLAVIIQETNRYMQQDAPKQEINQVVHILSQYA
jgi:hypothetical protein